MKKLEFPIKTERLQLRPLQISDQHDLLTYYSMEIVSRYLYIEPKNIDKVKEYLQVRIKHTSLQEKGDKLTLAAILPNENRVIGEVSLLLKKPEHHAAEIGYVFNPHYQGHGYASEAAGMMLKIGFEHYNFHRICARCDARNIASYKVMERLGMRREAHHIQNEFINGEWTDELEYAILKDEWLKKHSTK
jgi:RimJ/RimL family protein N-acetyltransferase